MTEGPQLGIQLFVDGTVRAETRQVHGDACVPFAALLEDLCAAEAIESAYTKDYWALQNQDATAEVQARDDR